MWYEYSLYLLFTLFGSFLLKKTFKLNVLDNHKLVFQTIFCVAIIFILWDVFAVFFNHWGFNHNFIIGVFIFNQPIEEILFFFVIPYFYLVVWEIFKKIDKVK